jgi:hypothetical protein
VFKVEIDIFASGVIGVVRGVKWELGIMRLALPVGPALNKAQPIDRTITITTQSTQYA